jgi:uncharacterized protein YhaN
MKLTAIQIARFGIWQQLALHVPGEGVTVFYGANEAGKTTLLEFIRCILYGFDPFGIPSTAYEPSGAMGSSSSEGALCVEQEGRRYEIRRVADRGTRGLVSVVGTDRQEPAETLLSELLHHTSAALFKNVFALGLDELQELATLHGDEIAHYIYGISLGPTGRRLLDAGGALEREIQGLLDSATRSGTLADLLERDESLREEIAAHDSTRAEHAELCVRRTQVEKRIQTLNRKRGDVERQAAAHRLLERVWPHWSEARRIRAELESLPHVGGFPTDGLERLKKLDEELESVTAARRAFAEEAKALRMRFRQLAAQRRLRNHVPLLVGFVEQGGWYGEIEQRIAAAQNRVTELTAERDQSLQQLGGEWTPARLETLETGHAAHRRLHAAAERYRSALRRRKRLVRKRKVLSRIVDKRSAVLDEFIKRQNGVSLDDALIAEQNRLKALNELGSLRVREAGLANRREALAASRDQLRSELPVWVPIFLRCVFGAGLTILAVGFYQAAFQFEVLAGAIFALVGLTGLGITWGLKRHAETQVQQRRDGDRVAAIGIDSELQSVRSTIGRITALPANLPLSGSAPAVSGAVDDAPLLRETIGRIAELEKWKQVQQSIQTRRRRMTRLRARFPSAQRELSAERHNWCSSLKGLGLAETVKIDEALEAWDHFVTAHERTRAWRMAAEELSHLERLAQSFRVRIEEAARRAGQLTGEIQQPLDILAAWDRDIQALDRVREDCRRTHRELRDRRRKAEDAKRRVWQLRARSWALFAKGGAGDRREFLDRAEWTARRRECEGLLSEADEALRAASASEPELAIVEEDLVGFEIEKNRERIESLDGEMDQLDRDVQAAFEELGSVKQSLKMLDATRDASRRRFLHAQTVDQLKRAVEKWLGAHLAREAVDRMRSKFERTCQPAVLASAAGYLQSLTGGRYHNIWTPLGQRELCIDDARGNTLRVPQLSGGTREQLFLAIRMAMVRELARKGIELPMVLDDVFVNFDQARTEAAVETLVDFASDNQQVLFFTCHLHLASLFESHKIEPVWLPAHDAPQEERRAG